MSIYNALICRLCGTQKSANDFNIDLSHVEDVNPTGIPGPTTFTNLISFYCRVDLNADPTLPQKVCRVCRLQVEVFVAFCHNLTRIESDLTGAGNLVVQEVRTRYLVET